MNELFGSTRDVVKERYALRTPSGFVPSVLPGWTGCVAIVQISPAMGANLSQLLLTLEKNGEGRGRSATLEHFVYVISGKCSAKMGAKKGGLKTGGFVFIPDGTDFRFSHAAKRTQL